MTPGEIVEDVTDLIFVASREWLRGRLRAEAEARAVCERRAARRASLRQVRARLEQLHEVDARIDLLEVSYAVPEREALIERLQELREHLVREQRRGR